MNSEVIPDDDFGYHSDIITLRKRKGYSGTAIFSKTEPLSIREDFPDPKHGGEGRGFTFEFDGFYLVNVYVPNSKGDLSRLPYRYDSWDPDLKDYLIELRQSKPVVLCGDLNVAHREIDLANPKTNRTSAGFTDEEREGFSNLLAEGFIDTLQAFTPRSGRSIFLVVLPGGCTSPECGLAY